MRVVPGFLDPEAKNEAQLVWYLDMQKRPPAKADWRAARFRLLLLGLVPDRYFFGAGAGRDVFLRFPIKIPKLFRACYDEFRNLILH